MRRPQFSIGKLELLILKKQIGENYMVVLSELVSNFHRHAKAEVARRGARGKRYGSITKTYPLECGLTAKMCSYVCSGELWGVGLKLKGLGGDFAFDLEAFVNGAERFLFEQNVLNAEETDE